jgi:hypothetical protein
MESVVLEVEVAERCERRERIDGTRQQLIVAHFQALKSGELRKHGRVFWAQVHT